MISSALVDQLAPCQNSSAPASSIQLNQYTNPISFIFSHCLWLVCEGVYRWYDNRSVIAPTNLHHGHASIDQTNTGPLTPCSTTPLAHTLVHTLFSNTTHTQSILNSTCTRSSTQPHTSTLAHNHTTHHPHRLLHCPRSLDNTHQHQHHTQQTHALSSLPDSTTHTQSFNQLPQLD